tara:strand:- start:24789 stop:26069 length:1281 start_codon:yes stop_codon:yes gene_type:complete
MIFKKDSKSTNIKNYFLENFLSLSFLQFFSGVLPLITIPFLTRVLGLQSFGSYIFIIAIITFLDLIISYGFRISATQKIAQNSKDRIKISKVFYSVLVNKIILFFAILLIILPLFYFVPSLSDNFFLILAGIPFLIGNLLFVDWLFQGMQRMKFISILHILSRVIFIIMIFIFVRNETDIAMAIFLYSFGVLVGGFLSFFIAIRMFNISSYIPSSKDIIQEYKDGYNVFISSFLVSLYSSVNVIILGIMHAEIFVSIYALGEKVFRLITSFVAPFNRAIFPILANQIKENRIIFVKDSKKYFYLIFSVFALFAIIIFFTAPFIINILGGLDAYQSILILKILSFAIPFFPLGAYTTYLLVINEKSQLLRRIVIFVVFINLLIIFPMTYFFKAIGVAIVTLLITILVTILQSYSVFSIKQNKIINNS